MTDSYREKTRELREDERMHIQAIKAAADTMAAVLNRDRPDPYCMSEAHKKLQECVFWAVKGIEKGITL